MPNGHIPPPPSKPRVPRAPLALEDALLGAAVARRAAHRLRITHDAAPLLALADALEAALPPAVPQASLARALRVTPQALKRWTANGSLRLEAPAGGGRPGVPAADALYLVERAELLRQPGRRRPHRPLTVAMANLRARRAAAGSGAQ